MASDFGDESARRGLTGLESIVHLGTQIKGEASTFLLRFQGPLFWPPDPESPWGGLLGSLLGGLLGFFVRPPFQPPV